MSYLTSPCLFLNKSWVPMMVKPVEDAITTAVKGDVLILDPFDYNLYNFMAWVELGYAKDADGNADFNRCVLSPEDKTVVGVRYSFRVPEIVVHSDYNDVPDLELKWNRKNLALRDNNECFIPSTQVMLWDGSRKAISDIVVGDKLIDAIGNQVFVEHVHVKYVENADLIRIRRRGNGDSVFCTAEHRILPFSRSGECLNADGIFASALTVETNLAEVVPCCTEFVETIDLLKFCSLPHLHKIVHRPELESMKDACESVKHYCGKPVRRLIPLDNATGRLIGYFYSEGSKVGNTVSFCFNLNENDYIEDTVSLVYAIFGIQARVETHEERNVSVVICDSSVVSEFFGTFCYLNGDKRLSKKCYSRTFLEGILSGVARGDGNFNNDLFRCNIMMSRPDLIRDIYTISLMCGLLPTLSKTGVRDDGRIYKSVIFQSEQFNAIAKMCGIPHKEWRQKRGSKVDRVVVENHLISKITNLSTVNYTGKVYDLQVSGSHTYVAGFVAVHNCQYCGRKVHGDEATIDHILPKTRGGKNSWTNTVIACFPCNTKKRDRVPEEAGMVLRSKPTKPRVCPLTAHYRGREPSSWAKVMKTSAA